MDRLKFVQFDFNPRSREGSDGSEDGNDPDLQDFNPRSREGSDRKMIKWDVAKLISIHAPAKGATVAMLHMVKNMQNFNPRSREGSDASKSKLHKLPKISIHAPAKGATVVPCIKAIGMLISIHAPAKGATIYTGAPIVVVVDFNPRSREGSDEIVDYMMEKKM